MAAAKTTNSVAQITVRVRRTNSFMVSADRRCRWPAVAEARTHQQDMTGARPCRHLKTIVARKWSCNTLSKKTATFYFCNNFAKCQPISTIYDINNKFPTIWHMYCPSGCNVPLDTLQVILGMILQVRRPNQQLHSHRAIQIIKITSNLFVPVYVHRVDNRALSWSTPRPRHTSSGHSAFEQWTHR